MSCTRDMLSRLGYVAGYVGSYTAGTALGSAALAATSAIAGICGPAILGMGYKKEAAIMGAVGGALFGGPFGLGCFVIGDLHRYCCECTGSAGIWFGVLSLLSQLTTLPLLAGEAALKSLGTELSVSYNDVAAAYAAGTAATCLVMVATGSIISGASMVRLIWEVNDHGVRKCRC